MFYLETSDGDKFFTAMHSNDAIEFQRILENKLGTDASRMFSEFIDSAYSEGYDAGFTEGESQHDY